jgi:hypothetical protein
LEAMMTEDAPRPEQAAIRQEIWERSLLFNWNYHARLG